MCSKKRQYAMNMTEENALHDECIARKDKKRQELTIFILFDRPILHGQLRIHNKLRQQTLRCCLNSGSQ